MTLCKSLSTSMALIQRSLRSSSNSISTKKCVSYSRSVTSLSLTSQKRKGRKISMVTAYDFPSAMHVQRANIDVILVGDSAAMVELGYDTTQPMTLDQMLHHCQAVHRGVTAGINRSDVKKPKMPLLVGDMPFGTYEYKDLDIALKNSYRMVKEGGMNAVKMEGGSEHRAETIKHVVDGGGKIPQSFLDLRVMSCAVYFCIFSPTCAHRIYFTNQT